MVKPHPCMEAAMRRVAATEQARPLNAADDIGPQQANALERSWYGRRASEHALPLSKLGCRTLGIHLTTTTTTKGR